MKQKEISRLSAREWWIEKSPATHQVAEWAWRGFIESSKYFVPNLLSEGLFFYKNDFIWEATPSQEKIKQFQYVLGRLKRNKKYLMKKRQAWDKLDKQTISAGMHMIEKMETLTLRELAQAYKIFTDLYLDQGRYSAFIECVDPYTEYILPDIIDHKLPKVKKSDRSKLISILAMPPVLSFMEQERIDLLAAARQVCRQDQALKKLSARLEKKYFWMDTQYGHSVYKTADKFADDIRQLKKKYSKAELKKELSSLQSKVKKIKKEQGNIYKKYHIDADLRRAFKVVNIMGSWIDDRKMMAMKGTFIVYRLMEHLKKRLGVSDKLIAYATYDELHRWINTGRQTVNKNELEKRRKMSVYYVKLMSSGRSKRHFIKGTQAVSLLKKIMSRSGNEELTGTVASAPVNKISGTVEIVMDPRHDNFSKGRILVVSMTRPEFLPMMRQAKAIITDEGGLTCHAAVVSRELKIPCIIGTKNATSLLNNGVKITIDLKNGKIIKK